MMGLTTGASWALGIGIVCAVVDWVAVVRRHRHLEYVAKPATLVAFVFAASQMGGSGGLAGWFRWALVFSLAGDVFLMFPAERWFLPGLVAFLVSHIFYIIGFNLDLPPVGMVVPLLLAALLDWVVLRRIVAGLRRSGGANLRLPVIVYGAVLSLTLVSGWTTWFRPGWTVTARIAATVGATLFYTSDLMLAWDRFVQQSRLLRVLVIVTYHLGQLGLVLVVGLHG